MLMIQNPGEAPVEGFTLLGVSTTRDCGVEGTIGKFGSGGKFAINVLLRAGLRVIVYSGRTKMEFKTRAEQVNDGLTVNTVQRVYVQFSGTSTKKVDLGFVLDFGAIDWTDLGMALREFISNAIDRTVREEVGMFEPALREGRLSVRKVADTEVRAKVGYTRVFIEIDEEIEQYLDELPKRFLHFSDDPGQVRQRLLPKKDRNLSDRQTPMIYREGVFVRELQESKAPSTYDYNFKTHELPIDESRNSSEYNLRAACAGVMKNTSATELAPIFRSLTDMTETFESELDTYYLCSPYTTVEPEQKANWQRAWEAVAGDSVMCEPTAQLEMLVMRKGHKAQAVQSAGWVQAAERFGVVTSNQVLTGCESKGREKRPVTPAVTKALDTVWGWINCFGVVNGKEKPELQCYRDLTCAESDTMGFYRNNTIYVREDIASGENEFLLKVVLEELVHYITGAGDGSRDFANFLIDLVVKACA